MRTFSVTILGCRVNHYEAEQIAAVLRARGLTQLEAPAGDVRVVHTCSVTSMAAKGSRQAVRRATRLPVLGHADDESNDGAAVPSIDKLPGAKVIVTGCWATSDRAAAEQLPGVDAVITHHDDVNAELERLLDQWKPAASVLRKKGAGTTSLPLLDARQDAHQRAFLKIQDGCDAHCTYCIIPQLRPNLWSKPIDEAVLEAQQLVRAGHRELVLTGIFLGAYGHPTALRRRQTEASKPIIELIEALCTRVEGLSRLRLSSMEPGDLTPDLIRTLRRHAPIVPHFHLPLQSGSDAILRRMNRQYTRGDYLDMVAQVNDAFDRPAITTDVIAGFPGESEAEFEQTVDVVERAKFTHIHAFPYSPRPNTAAARWKEKAIPHMLASDRVKRLQDRAAVHASAFAETFCGETVTVLVENPGTGSPPVFSNENEEHGLKTRATMTVRHGRSERYFDVCFDADDTVQTGDLVSVRVDRVTPTRIHGTLVTP